MSLEGMSSFTQLMAALAGVGSLVFVGLEIRHSAQVAQAQTEQHLASSTFAVSKAIADHAALFAAGLGSTDTTFSNLRPEERLAFVTLLFGLFKHYENMFRQAQKGHIDAHTWAAWSVHLRMYFNQPGVRAWWQLRGETFDPEFRRYLETAPPVSMRTPAQLVDVRSPG